jgi:hypothetical protein
MNRRQLSTPIHITGATCHTTLSTLSRGSKVRLPIMEENSEKELGELLINKDNIRVYSNGIADYYGDYLLWDEIDYIYVGGTRSSVNYIPTMEDRTIKLVQSSSNRHVDILLSSWFRMRKEKQQLFNDIYSAIMKNTFDRLWSQFIQQLHSGTRLSFDKFEMTKDAFYFRKFFKGYNEINISSVKKCEINQGIFYFFVHKSGKYMYPMNVGKIEEIPNIHIIQAYINLINK